jgi:hypothetical protein
MQFIACLYLAGSKTGVESALRVSFSLKLPCELTSGLKMNALAGIEPPVNHRPVNVKLLRNFAVYLTKFIFFATILHED